jgi:hypothetical protein
MKTVNVVKKKNLQEAVVKRLSTFREVTRDFNYTVWPFKNLTFRVCLFIRSWFHDDCLFKKKILSVFSLSMAMKKLQNMFYLFKYQKRCLCKHFWSIYNVLIFVKDIKPAVIMLTWILLKRKNIKDREKSKLGRAYLVERNKVECIQ